MYLTRESSLEQIEIAGFQTSSFLKQMNISGISRIHIHKNIPNGYNKHLPILQFQSYKFWQLSI